MAQPAPGPRDLAWRQGGPWVRPGASPSLAVFRLSAGEEPCLDV